MARRIAIATDSGLVVAEGERGGWTVESLKIASRPTCIAVDGRNPKRVLLGTHGDGLLRGTDGAESLERAGRDAFDVAAVTALASHPTDPDRLLAGTEPSRLYASDDGGATWALVDDLNDLPSASEWSFPPRPETHHVRWIEIDPSDPKRWYVGIEAGALLVTEDGGATWIDRPPGSRRDNHTLATHPDDPGRVYAAAGDGYAESTDGGRTWTIRHDGLDHTYVWGMAVDRGDPDTIIVSAASSATSAHREGDAHLYRRADAGSWSRLTDVGVPTGVGHRRAVLAAGPTAGEFVAATEDGVFHATDGGRHWRRLGFELPDAHEGALPRGLAVVALA